MTVKCFCKRKDNFTCLFMKLVVFLGGMEEKMIFFHPYIISTM